MVSNINTIPKLAGIYLMRNARNTIVYVGKARNLFNRIKSYFSSRKDFRLINIMFFNVKEIDYIICNSEEESLLLEQRLIQTLKPEYNIFWKDDKSYPLIEITLSEKYPKVNFVRNKDFIIKDKKNKYFGPYPSANKLKSFISWMLKFFRLRHCKYDSNNFPAKEEKDKRKFMSCIYLQTKQCSAPCLGGVSLKEYRRLINNLILFLNGRWRKLVSELKLEMKKYSYKKEFEKAIVLRELLSLLGIPFRK